MTAETEITEEVMVETKDNNEQDQENENEPTEQGGSYKASRGEKKIQEIINKNGS